MVSVADCGFLECFCTLISEKTKWSFNGNDNPGKAGCRAYRFSDNVQFGMWDNCLGDFQLQPFKRVSLIQISMQQGQWAFMDL
jgi:hypothetical protein